MTESKPNEPGSPAEAARPQPGAEGAAQRDVDLMHARVETLREELRSLNRTLVILGVVAAVACLTAFAGLSKSLAARDDVAKAARMLRIVNGKLKKLRSERAPQPTRMVPIASAAQPRVSDRSHEVMLLELGQLQRIVGSAPAQQAEVEASFVAWGQEVRQYVDDALVQADEGHRRERGDELRPVFQRLLEIEERLPR